MPTQPSTKLLGALAISLGLITGSAAGQASSGSPSVNVSIPPSITEKGFTGSVPSGQASSEVLSISFLGAIDRGLKQNLGLLL
jgi:hypothetical protein